MPRNGSGVYSKPAGTTAVPNTTIESAKYNSTIDDIAADLNLARPIVAGGTGATTAASARTGLGFSSDAGNFGKQGANIASAATTDLSTATGDYVNITGTTTITSFGTAPAGTRRTLKFASTPIITHGANIILANGVSFAPLGDTVFEFVSEGSGVWREVSNVAARGSYTPVAASTVGTITAYTAAGIWVRQNGCVYVEVTVDISNGGTGSQSVSVSLPFNNNASFRSIFSGLNVATGKALTGNLALGSANMGVIYYDNTYPGATGATLRLTGFYFL